MIWLFSSGLTSALVLFNLQLRGLPIERFFQPVSCDHYRSHALGPSIAGSLPAEELFTLSVSKKLLRLWPSIAA